jgi:hypothetical protein
LLKKVDQQWFVAAVPSRFERQLGNEAADHFTFIGRPNISVHAEILRRPLGASVS